MFLVETLAGAKSPLTASAGPRARSTGELCDRTTSHRQGASREQWLATHHAFSKYYSEPLFVMLLPPTWAVFFSATGII